MGHYDHVCLWMQVNLLYRRFHVIINLYYHIVRIIDTFTVPSTNRNLLINYSAPKELIHY